MDERHPDLAAGRRLLAEARAAAEGPAWAIPLRRDAAEHWLFDNADALLADADALESERRRAEALRLAVIAALACTDGMDTPPSAQFALTRTRSMLRRALSVNDAPGQEGEGQ